MHEKLRCLEVVRLRVGVRGPIGDVAVLSCFSRVDLLGDPD